MFINESELKKRMNERWRKKQKVEEKRKLNSMLYKYSQKKNGICRNVAGKEILFIFIYKKP
jgi:hypothetical protein